MKGGIHTDGTSLPVDVFFGAAFWEGFFWIKNPKEMEFPRNKNVFPKQDLETPTKCWF